MLKANIEFTKGVLFVRLFGEYDKESEEKIENKIINILNRGGIKYLVFNIKEINIDEKISLFNSCEKKIKENDGKMIICGNKDMNFKMASDELNALRMIFAC